MTEVTKQQQHEDQRFFLANKDILTCNQRAEKDEEQTHN